MRTAELHEGIEGQSRALDLGGSAKAKITQG